MSGDYPLSLTDEDLSASLNALMLKGIRSVDTRIRLITPKDEEKTVQCLCTALINSPRVRTFVFLCVSNSCNHHDDYCVLLLNNNNSNDYGNNNNGMIRIVIVNIISYFTVTIIIMIVIIQ